MTISLIARSARGALAALLLVVVGGGCSLDGQGVPSLSGPSEFGLSISASATPDQLFRNGAAQSTVTVTAIGPDGKPLGGQSIAVAVSSTGTTGKVTADVVTAGPDGRASFVVIAPPADSVGDEIVVELRPVGTNAGNTVARRFIVGVYPSNPKAPELPAGTTLGPSDGLVGEEIVFNASGAQDDGVDCQRAGCTFEWSFGDGTGDEGPTVTKTYGRTGRFPVRLTVRDRVGATTVFTHVITINALEPAVISVSPNPPLVGQGATFTVTLKVPPGVQILRYEWNFDGVIVTTTGPSASHTYNDTNGHTVTVSVIGASGDTLSTGVLSFTPETP